MRDFKSSKSLRATALVKTGEDLGISAFGNFLELSPSGSQSTAPLLAALHNLLEPPSLADAFYYEPAEGFSPFRLPLEGCPVHGFLTQFNLMTTMDKEAKDKVDGLLGLAPQWLQRGIQRMLSPLVMFVGSPATEYTLLPENVHYSKLTRFLLSTLEKTRAIAVIVKDLPKESPLLTPEENRYASDLMDYMRAKGFLIMSGQALAYLPVDFASIEDYMGRFSRKRRSDFKRKLKSFDDVEIGVIPTGDASITEALLDRFYQLYEHVYDKSYIHFEKLTPGFFRSLFLDAGNQGRIFTYTVKGELIGFNLGFIFDGMLVEKYVGYQYPDAREHNLYFLAWFYRLQYCLDHGLKTVIAGWTNPEIKAYLGAHFTQTYHAVYIRNKLFRLFVERFQFLFESDEKTLAAIT